MFEIVPKQGVGPFRLGMPYAETTDAMRSVGELVHYCLGGLRATRPNGLTFKPHTFNGDVVESIEIWAPHEQGGDRVFFDGVDVFGVPRDDVLAALRRHDAVTDWANGAYEAQELGLSLWAEDPGTIESFTIAVPDPPEDRLSPGTSSTGR